MNNVYASDGQVYTPYPARQGDVVAGDPAPSRVAQPVDRSGNFPAAQASASREARVGPLFAAVGVGVVGALLGSVLGYVLAPVESAPPTALTTEQFLKKLDAEPVRSDPASYELTKASLDASIDKTNKAIESVNRLIDDENYLSNAQKSEFKGILGKDILNKDNLLSLKKSSINVLHGLNYLKSHEENNRPVIYMGDLSKDTRLDRNAPAYTPSVFDPAKGRYGYTILNKQYMKELTGMQSEKKRDELSHIITHEVTHMMMSTDDHWYGPKTPAGYSTPDALKIADAVTYGIDFLSRLSSTSKPKKDEF